MGRIAGSQPSYDYTAALQESGIIWNRSTIDLFITDPLALIPGTTMAYAGMASAEDRATVVAYLSSLGGGNADGGDEVAGADAGADGDAAADGEQ
jgi:cytochrome c